MTQDEIAEQLKLLGVQMPSPELTDRLADEVLSDYYKADITHLRRLMRDLDSCNAIACLITQHMAMVCAYLGETGGDASIVEYLQNHMKKYLPDQPDQTNGPKPHNRWSTPKSTQNT